MSADPKRRGLGRGLSALLGEDAGEAVEPSSARAPRLLPIGQLRPSRFQPRRGIDEDGLQELAVSIAEKGVLQPVLVRRVESEEAGFEIIAGERRWRAAKAAGVIVVVIVALGLWRGQPLIEPDGVTVAAAAVLVAATVVSALLAWLRRSPSAK